MSAALVAEVAAQLLKRGERLAVAESCTGGLIAAACTELAGSSAWFERGVVSYANTAKQDLLGVPQQVLVTQGAVSEVCVRAMAKGLLMCAPVQHTLAVSGIAGPTGGSAEKPVGTVWIAWANADRVTAERFLFSGDRASIRQQAVAAAFAGLLQQLG